MDQAAHDMLRADAARYIWWESPDEAMRRPARVIAQVMNIGDLDDVQDLLRSVGEASFREVLGNAEPGWFNERSWHYWHHALGVCHPGETVPQMPARRFN
ncbi:MAG: hypothetical protein Q8K67_00405 [Geothrix sp.]|nr:hypothetical protein [Geothrix sp.]